MSRVQTGVRIEKPVLKVLKALAEYEETSLGALLERIVLSSFAGEGAFDEAALAKIAELGRIYDLDRGGTGDAGTASDPPTSRSPAAPEGDTLGEALDGLSQLLGAEG